MAASTTADLEIENLSLEFRTKHEHAKILDRVSLTVNKGEITGLVGESGCGKSVLALTAMGLLPGNLDVASSGRISILGTDVLGRGDAELEDIRGSRVSMIFQEPMTALNPTIRIGKQMTGVLRRHLKISSVEAYSRARKLLDEVAIRNVDDVLCSYPFALSGGMRQRVLIAMAFSCTPSLIFADEPTTALDVTVQAQILELLRRLAKIHGTSILFITHDFGVVRQLCERVYVLYAGQIVEAGPAATILDSPRHPYTASLLNSLPQKHQRKTRLPSIDGVLPSLSNPPAGCRFSTRCEMAFEPCSTRPASVVLNRDEGGDVAGHHVNCWLYADDNQRQQP